MSLKDGEKRVGEVLQAVEPIGYLSSLRCTARGSFGIGAGAVTSDDADSWMFLEPGSDGLSLAIAEANMPCLGTRIEQLDGKLPQRLKHPKALGSSSEAPHEAVLHQRLQPLRQLIRCPVVIGADMREGLDA